MKEEGGSCCRLSKEQVEVFCDNLRHKFEELLKATLDKALEDALRQAVQSQVRYHGDSVERYLSTALATALSQFARMDYWASSSQRAALAVIIQDQLKEIPLESLRDKTVKEAMETLPSFSMLVEAVRLAASRGTPLTQEYAALGGVLPLAAMSIVAQASADEVPQETQCHSEEIIQQCERWFAKHLQEPFADHLATIVANVAVHAAMPVSQIPKLSTLKVIGLVAPMVTEMSWEQLSGKTVKEVAESLPDYKLLVQAIQAAISKGTEVGQEFATLEGVPSALKPMPE